MVEFSASPSGRLKCIYTVVPNHLHTSDYLLALLLITFTALYSMSDPFTTASSDFDDTCVGAEALFFVDKYGTKSLRLEAQDLALEFTDGLYIGTGMGEIIGNRRTQAHESFDRSSRYSLLYRRHRF